MEIPQSLFSELPSDFYPTDKGIDHERLSKIGTMLHTKHSPNYIILLIQPPREIMES